jgi:hypothetical protein
MNTPSIFIMLQLAYSDYTQIQGLIAATAEGDIDLSAVSDLFLKFLQDGFSIPNRLGETIFTCLTQY